MSTPAKHSSTHHINNLNRDSPDYIFHLQRTIGNQAVLRLVHSNAREFDFAKIGIIQPKLKVSQPGDPYEQEADKVAEQVMRMSNSTDSIEPITPTNDEGRVHHVCSACGMNITEEEEESVNISRKPSLSTAELETRDETMNQINHIRHGSGFSLDGDTKKFMESRFGYDFSNVRIHADERAATSASSVNALSYTVGNDIVFGGGQYQPNTTQGRRLLAHELTHTIQQGASAQQVTDPWNSAEERALIVAGSVMKRRSLDVQLHEPLEIARQPSSPASAPGVSPPSPQPTSTPAVPSPSSRGRPPDVVHAGYHSFIIRSMIPGERTEVKVQFYQDPSVTSNATFAVWYQETNTLERVSFTPTGAIRPILLDERMGIARFDLNGDGVSDIDLTAWPNPRTQGVDFTATLNGRPLLMMAALPPRPASNYVPGKGFYMGNLPDGRPYYLVPGSTMHPAGPFFVDDRNQAVNPGLEAQGAAINRVFGSILVGAMVLSATAAAFAVIGILAAEVGAAATTELLIAALGRAGVKFTAEAIVGITRTVAGRIVWLEVGSASAGLTHIMARHASQFATWGLRSGQQVANLIIQTLATRAPIAVQGGGAFDFAVNVGGVERILRIVIGSNGFIVTAHPL